MDTGSRADSLRGGLATTALLLVFGACYSSTKTEQTWMSRAALNGPPLTNVVTLFTSDNATMRRAGEDRLAHELADEGIRATPAYMILGERDVSDQNAVRETLRTMGYDGLVTMKIIDREYSYDYGAGYYGGDYYWGYPWPDYGYTTTTYRVEASAYSLTSNQLVWSALIRETDPDSSRDLLRDTTEEAAEQLSSRRVARPVGPG